MKLFRVMIVILLAAPAMADGGFEPLFNGTDLSGWEAVGMEEAFIVKNGAIHSTGAGPYPSWLRSAKPYENFVFRFEYQTEGWHEGGVLFHAPSHGPASAIGLKMHLRHDQKPYGVRSSGALYDLAAPAQVASHASGKWNQCEIVCDWPSLRITMNGTVIHDIDMDDDARLRHRLRSGYLGIQNIGCKAYFKNLEIKPLPGKENWIDLTANGLDGFRETGHADWSVKDKTIIGQGEDGFLITKQEFEGPFELQAWVKTMVNGNGGVNFYWEDESHGVEVQCFNAPDSTNPTGSFYNIAPAMRIASRDEEWFFMQIFVDGANAMSFVNGELVARTDQLKPPYKGGVAFTQHTPGGYIEYRNARIKRIEWR